MIVPGRGWLCTPERIGVERGHREGSLPRFSFSPAISGTAVSGIPGGCQPMTRFATTAVKPNTLAEDGTPGELSGEENSATE